jgi:hypothetical protein
MLRTGCDPGEEEISGRREVSDLARNPVRNGKRFANFLVAVDPSSAEPPQKPRLRDVSARRLLTLTLTLTPRPSLAGGPRQLCNRPRVRAGRGADGGRGLERRRCPPTSWLASAVSRPAASSSALSTPSSAVAATYPITYVPRVACDGLTGSRQPVTSTQTRRRGFEALGGDIPQCLCIPGGEPADTRSSPSIPISRMAYCRAFGTHYEVKPCNSGAELTG